MPPEIRMDTVDQIVARHGSSAEAVIPILQSIQKHYRYLPDEALRRVCDTTDVTPANIASILTFFPSFRRRPAGEHTICVCDGTACHLKGAPEVFEAIAETLELGADEDTDRDGTFTLKKVHCLGCCTLAPAVQIDEVTYGHVSPDSVNEMLDAFRAHTSASRTARPEGWRQPAAKAEIRINLGSCCVAGGSDNVRRAVEEVIANYRLDVRVKQVSCVGMCHQVPLLEVVIPDQSPKMYARVAPEDVPSIVLNLFPPQRAISRARAIAARWLERLYTDDAAETVQRRTLDASHAPVAAFLGKQVRVATERYGENDPCDLEEYRRTGGFDALRKCLERAPEDIVSEIERSGLRGRGGAGFATALKWTAVRQARNADKYVVCNGDEGDPGAFMDRMILESFPYRVIEGMLIAALAVGARRGIFYIRAEYPLAVTRVRTAIALCVQAGILGDRVMDTAHAFHVEVREGTGAFVCGEETSLIASLEGLRPTPRLRPPYPAQRGLNGRPTLVNNVETLSLVPWILRNGAEAFARLGASGSAGTKVFSLAGKIRRGGLIEVPMGLTIGEIVEEIGGGAMPGRKFKAVQVGGPSGGCIPASLTHLPVDYEALTSAGSMMGSGGFVVLDDTDCMVEMSRYFLSFTQMESCGKCTPCRVGTKEMLEILNRLCEGTGALKDLDRLEELARVIKRHSVCGLGRTAPNPVLTAMRHFREEFEAHAQGRCLAHKCKAFVRYYITQDCIGCTKCAQRCPAEAIQGAPYQVHEIDRTRCVRCGACHEICPVQAVKVD